MTGQTSPSTAATLQPRSPGLRPAPADGSVLMTCDVCDLTGGPFAPAEAAYLRAIHDRVHHGISLAA